MDLIATPLRKLKTALHFYRQHKYVAADVRLATRHSLDLAWLYLRRPNGEVAYYNLLFSVALASRPRMVLELGTGPGISSLAFIRVLQYWREISHDQRVLHTCDVNAVAARKLRRFGSIVVPYITSTDELAVRWAEQRLLIDLLYIDADHSHEQSLSDFENFAPWIVPNGLVLMHDTFPRREEDESPYASGTAWKTAQYIKQHYATQFEIMTLPYLCGLSLLRKSGAKYF